MSTARPLIIVGLDGATLDLVLPWVREGRLPTFARILEEGVHGELRSTQPPLTCPAWPVLVTGKNPGKIGVGDFIVDEGEGTRVVTVDDVLAEPFWDVAGREGCRSVVVNVPVTYPPRIVNGLLFSGMLTPPGQRSCSSPEVYAEVVREVGGYATDLDILTLSSLARESSLARFHELMEQRFRAVTYLQQRHPAELLFAVFKDTDVACHRLWHQPEEILRVYQNVDRYIGALLAAESNLFVVSDHGFAEFTKVVRVNQLLHELGVLVRRDVGADDGITHGSTKIQQLRFGAASDGIYRMLRRAVRVSLSLGVSRAEAKRALRRVGLHAAVKKRVPNILKRMLPPARHTVDRERSQAFLQSSRTSSITIRRERLGATGETYERFRDRLRAKLLELRDPENGRPVISCARRREDIYRGPYVERLPDLYLEAADGYLIRSELGLPIVEPFPSPKSAHSPRGLFLGWGPDVARARRLDGLELVDAAPTFLHLLGAAIPEDLDGRVVREAFREGSDPHGRPERTARPLAVERAPSRRNTEEEEEQIREHLRGLGYMD
jgi:predicted AlkP superfamily phosphohydrolase/phosphomutase